MPKVDFGTFSMEAPADWTLSTIGLAGPVEATSSGDDVLSYQRNLVVTMEQVPPEDTARGYVERTRNSLSAAGILHEVGEPETVQLARGGEAVLIEQVVVVQDGHRVRQLQLVFLKGGLAHTATASHRDGQAFEQVRAEFREMLLSFS